LEQKLNLDGTDAWPTIAAGKPTPHDQILHNTTPGNGAIRVGDWKLVLNGSRSEDGSEALAQPGGKGKKNKGSAEEVVELFNIPADPYEKTNVASQHPEKVQELRARLDAYAKAALPPKSAPKAADFQTPAVWGQ
jgi:hypothetical protein